MRKFKLLRHVARSTTTLKQTKKTTTTSPPVTSRQNKPQPTKPNRNTKKTKKTYTQQPNTKKVFCTLSLALADLQKTHQISNPIT